CRILDRIISSLRNRNYERIPMLVFNAHTHLNGSISIEYLEATAKRNGCEDFFKKFVGEPDLWKKFGWIHQIMQTPKDIKLATIDVVKHTKADFIEIRTTPKPMGKHSVDEYVQALVEGLIEAKREYPTKQARGLLSIDRARHSLSDAKWIIDTALKEKQ